MQAIVLSKDVAFRRPGAHIELPVVDGVVQVDTKQDAIMVAVAERYGKTDNLEGMKENVICGHLIPAGTGLRDYNSLVVGSKEDFEYLDKSLDARLEAEAAEDAAKIKKAEEKGK